MNLLLGRREGKLGEQFPYSYFGPYERREIGDHLKILKKWIKHSNNHFCTIFSSGLEWKAGVLFFVKLLVVFGILESYIHHVCFCVPLC